MWIETIIGFLKIDPHRLDRRLEGSFPDDRAHDRGGAQNRRTFLIGGAISRAPRIECPIDQASVEATAWTTII
jgi:hypothetical protein